MAEEILKVEHLNKFYGDWQALHDINFELKKGEVVTLLGPSGSGKSTLIRTLNGLEPFRDGSIYFKGNKVNPSPKKWQELRQKIGMVFQSYDLFPNLTVLERVDFADQANSYPRQLSGGQKQRIAIVRALAMHPELMLFDEVTASLDPEMVRGVLEIIKELSDRDHMTMIIVTHEMNFAAQIADQVLFLEDGRILEETPGKQFFEHPQTARAEEFLSSMEF